MVALVLLSQEVIPADCSEIYAENQVLNEEFKQLVLEIRAFANGLITEGETEIGEGLLSLVDGE